MAAGCAVPDHVKTVSMLSFQEGDKDMTSYSSSNYVTVEKTKERRLRRN